MSPDAQAFSKRPGSRQRAQRPICVSTTHLLCDLSMRISSHSDLAVVLIAGVYYAAAASPSRGTPPRRRPVASISLESPPSRQALGPLHHGVIRHALEQSFVIARCCKESIIAVSFHLCHIAGSSPPSLQRSNLLCELHEEGLVIRHMVRCLKYQPDNPLQPPRHTRR